MSKNKVAALTNEQKIKNLRAAIIEGEASGPATPFDINDTTGIGPKLSGDRPRKFIDDDEFGLGKIVEAIATNITANVPVEGYTVGLDGDWGSGKTTVTNFIIQRIKELTPQARVIKIDPWLIGNKAAFISSFLADLANKIDEYECSTKRWWNFFFWFKFWFKQRFNRSLAVKIRKYGEYSNALSTTVAGLGLNDPTGVIGLTAVGLKGMGTLSKLINPSAKSISALKSDIVDSLRKLADQQRSPRFVVIIDDSDRLEPTEAVEILRLIREVADFPLTTYLVCFDKGILAQQIRSALKIRNGLDYIEKIFHQIISVPPQEPFALRRYLAKLLSASFPVEFHAVDPNDKEYEYRKHILMDIWTGKFLKTPRDVIRLHEAVVFGWPHLPKGADFFDFVWLQLIRLNAPNLYTFTQSYLVEVGAYRDGGRPSDDAPETQAKELFDIMGKLGWQDKPYRSGIGDFLPGVKQFAFDNTKRKLFQFEHDELAYHEKHGRLGSPSHWRQYFAFSLPTYALSDDEIAGFRNAAGRSGGEASAKLLELLHRQHTRCGHYVDVLIERLNDLPDNALSNREMSGISEAFSNTMDDIAIATGERKSSGSNEIWRKATMLLKRSKPTAFHNLAKTGKAVGWLSDVVRDQGFAYGRPTGNRESKDRQWLNARQLDKAIALLVGRFKKINSVKLFDNPSPLDIFYLWQQLGDETELRSSLMKWTKGDDEFLKAIDAMRGWSSSSNVGIRHPLRKLTVAAFMDADKAKTRLQKIASDRSTMEDMKSRAQSLLSEWEDDTNRDR